MADTDQVLKLAAIIREVDGDHSKGAAALAELILNHPSFHQCCNEPAPPADGEVADDALALFVESQRPMDPEVAAILTPDVLWDLYEGTPLPADGSRRTQEIRADILTIAPELENNG